MRVFSVLARGSILKGLSAQRRLRLAAGCWILFFVSLSSWAQCPQPPVPCQTFSITTFAAPTSNAAPTHIIKGRDGALWFLENGKIGRITTAGVITEYGVSGATSQLVDQGITTGPDGAVWFLDFNSAPGAAVSFRGIGRMDASGLITQYPLPGALSFADGITTGTDGTVWFTETDGLNLKIGRVTTTGAISEFSVPTSGPIPIPGAGDITTGPDGALWFTEGNRIGRMTTSGAYTEYALADANSGAAGITSGPDGAVWFTERDIQATPESDKIGRITTAGVLTEYPINLPPGASGVLRPAYIVPGPDGALWFSLVFSGIGRITTSGAISVYNGSGLAATDIIWGPDGALWFTNAGGGYIGRATLTGLPDRVGSFAQVASGAGWSTNIILTNLSVATVNAQINFHADDGSPLTLPLSFPNSSMPSTTSASPNLTIAANQSVEIQSASSSATMNVGWADVTASGPLEGYAVFGESQSTVFSSAGTVLLDTRLSSSLVLPFDNTSGSKTGIALANQSLTAATITVVVFDQGGSRLASSQMTLPAMGHTSFFVTDQFSQAANRIGVIEFQNPSGNVTGVGLLFYPGGAFTSLPTIQ